ncbi:hypothetical protein VTK56DRAFT_4640 [Thermocarpiscus australiensis]
MRTPVRQTFSSFTSTKLSPFSSATKILGPFSLQSSHLVSFIYQRTMTPRFFSCSIPECERPSVRAVGGCDSCNSQLCLTHLSPSSHKCDKVREADLLCLPSPGFILGFSRWKKSNCGWMNRSWMMPRTYRRLSPRSIVSALSCSLRACVQAGWRQELQYRALFQSWAGRSHGKRQLPRPRSLPPWLSLLALEGSASCEFRCWPSRFVSRVPDTQRVHHIEVSRNHCRARTSGFQLWCTRLWNRPWYRRQLPSHGRITGKTMDRRWSTWQPGHQGRESKGLECPCRYPG